ncbi:MAG: hypothetical protein Q9171_004804 [Xanthocarpia ochracea]
MRPIIPGQAGIADTTPEDCDAYRTLYPDCAENDDDRVSPKIVAERSLAFTPHFWAALNREKMARPPGPHRKEPIARGARVPPHPQHSPIESMSRVAGMDSHGPPPETEQWAAATKANDAKDRIKVDTLAEERDHEQSTRYSGRANLCPNPERVKLNDCYVEPANVENLERDEPDLGEEDKDDDDLRHKPPYMAGFPHPISPWLHSPLWSLASTWTPELLSRWSDPRKRWAPELQEREFSLRHFTDETMVDRPYEPRGKWLSPVLGPANL